MVDTTKHQSVPHLDYAPILVVSKAKPFSEPWPGENPTSSQRAKYVDAYLNWARQGDPSSHAAVRDHESSRIVGALPLVRIWTEAETEHLYYLLDEEYWHLWRESPHQFSSFLLPNQFFPTSQRRQAHAHLALEVPKPSVRALQPKLPMPYPPPSSGLTKTCGRFACRATI
ncbi:hypothetical protein FBEOM_5922 [Fusarium beomiforme]|uniref:Uncharacterized protein n=1 Tax=Fusarium beomiforme TaxID=44412 RepID=A0A9P5DYK4_9HYPO|nr:hypothetical protein FBEOM_5922 [Fusarium beomiforme]